MINYKAVIKYCCEDISLIENFEKAAADTTQVWHIHHRKETDENTTRATLIKNGLYYDRPANELIFLTKAKHNSVHFKDKKLSEDLKHKMSESGKGKVLSEEHRKHISEATSGENNGMYGKNHSEESRKKISETRKARIAAGEIVVNTSQCHTVEGNKKISEKAKERLKDPTKHPMYGRHQSEETKRKISEANKGRIRWNKRLKIKKDA